MSKALEKALELYYVKFNDSFPTVPLMAGRSDDEVIKIIKECVDKEKDVYDLGYLKLDDDILY